MKYKRIVSKPICIGFWVIKEDYMNCDLQANYVGFQIIIKCWNMKVTKMNNLRSPKSTSKKHVFSTKLHCKSDKNDENWQITHKIIKSYLMKYKRIVLKAICIGFRIL